MFLEGSHLVASCHQHVAKLNDFGAAAYRAATRDEDDLIGKRSEIGVGGANLPVNAAAGRIIDKGVDSVPPGVPKMDDIGVGEVNPDVAVGVGRALILHGDSGIVSPALSRNSTVLTRALV